jgi:hypothetical protein
VTDVVFEPTTGLNEELARQEASEQAQQPVVYVPMLALAWIVGALVFTLLRLGLIWHNAVGGAELVQLSGAWMARTGAPDDRFVPTLFQAITAGLLHWSDSEIPARVLAYASTATIPLAVFTLRRYLTDAGAIIALVLLSLEPLAIQMGSSASAMGFDLAVTMWLFVAVVRRDLPWWGWASVAFAVVSAGPTALPLVGAALGVGLARRRYPSWPVAVAASAGVVTGVVLATFRYGLGASGLHVAPFQLFADAYSQAWNSATTFDLFIIYAVPMVLGGMVAGAFTAYRLVNDDGDDARSQEMRLLLVVWAAVAVLWLVSSFASHSSVSIIAATVPCALLLGPAIVQAIVAMTRADWQIARFVVPLVLFLGLFFGTIGAGWVHNGDSPTALPIVAVAVLIVGVLAGIWWLRTTPSAAPTLWAFPMVVGGVIMLTGGLGVAFSGVGELVPSPTSPQQTRELRNILLHDLTQSGGQLVVHPSLWPDLTWPLRDSGTIVVSSRVPATAGAVIWPEDAAKPDGLNPLQGTWNILETMRPPTASFSDYYEWFTNRGTVVSTPTQAAVYVRPAP